MQPFGHNRHGPKIGGGLRPLFGEGELGPHLTQCGQRRGPCLLWPNGCMCQNTTWYTEVDLSIGYIVLHFQCFDFHMVVQQH